MTLQGNETQQCIRCGEHKLRTDFVSRRGKICSSCKATAQRSSYHAVAVPDGSLERRCKQCEMIYPLKMFTGKRGTVCSNCRPVVKPVVIDKPEDKVAAQLRDIRERFLRGGKVVYPEELKLLFKQIIDKERSGEILTREDLSIKNELVDYFLR